LIAGGKQSVKTMREDCEMDESNLENLVDIDSYRKLVKNFMNLVSIEWKKAKCRWKRIFIVFLTASLPNGSILVRKGHRSQQL
jgi:hypothetical protein